jgi:hypothetical protein
MKVTVRQLLLGAMLPVFVYSLPAAAAFDDSRSVFPPSEPSRWSMAFENDLLAQPTSDKDYTFGLSFSFSDGSLDEHWSTAALRDIDDRFFGEFANARYSIETGVYAFTPADADNPASLDADRPYAGLIYIASVGEHVCPGTQRVLRSHLSVGMLGSSIVGDIQNAVHDAIGSAEEAGWGRQISDGGEPTLRYSASLQSLIAQRGRLELKHTSTVSVGYITEASWALSARFGNAQSNWYRFNPEIVTYAEASPKSQEGTAERYFWAGGAIKFRAYNAFLQGQIRDSVHSYNAEDLRHALVEAWLGYTHGFGDGYYFSYGLRGHSSELKDGPADRNVVWGGLNFGRRLD